MQDGIGRIQDSTEKIQLLTQDLKGKPVRLVIPCEEVDHGDIALLAIPVASPDPLLDALRVPGQIVVNHRLAELKVQAFCAGFGADENFRTRAELVYEREPDSNLAARFGSRRETGALLLLPACVRLVRALVIVYAAEQGDVLVAQADSQ